MLPNSETTNPKAIEENVCLKIEKSQKHQMDNDTAELLLRLVTAKGIDIPENKKPFLYKIIESRAKCYQFSIPDNRLLFMLTQVSKSAGNAVMYLWYLQYWCSKNNRRELDLNVFCERIFPMGFPNDKDLQTIWDGQKVKRQEGSDNLVDYATAGYSLKFKN